MDTWSGEVFLQVTQCFQNFVDWSESLPIQFKNRIRKCVKFISAKNFVSLEMHGCHTPRLYRFHHQLISTKCDALPTINNAVQPCIIKAAWDCVHQDNVKYRHSDWVFPAKIDTCVLRVWYERSKESNLINVCSDFISTNRIIISTNRNNYHCFKIGFM